jgi:hypothetical protein
MAVASGRTVEAAGLVAGVEGLAALAGVVQSHQTL